MRGDLSMLTELAKITELVKEKREKSWEDKKERGRHRYRERKVKAKDTGKGSKNKKIWEKEKKVSTR